MEGSHSGSERHQDGDIPVPSRPSSDAFSSMSRVVLPLSDADDFLSDFNVRSFNAPQNGTTPFLRCPAPSYFSHEASSDLFVFCRNPFLVSRSCSACRRLQGSLKEDPLLLVLLTFSMLYLFDSPGKVQGLCVHQATKVHRGKHTRNFSYSSRRNCSCSCSCICRNHLTP